MSVMLHFGGLNAQRHRHQHSANQHRYITHIENLLNKGLRFPAAT
jgi:hypothetical protein